MLDPISISTQATDSKQDRKEKKQSVAHVPHISTAGDNQESFARQAAQQVRLNENEKLSLQQVPTVNYDYAKLIKALVPGDILLIYKPKITTLSSAVIRTGQVLSQTIYGNDLPAGAHNFTHAAMYVGNGNITRIHFRWWCGRQQARWRKIYPQIWDVPQLLSHQV